MKLIKVKRKDGRATSRFSIRLVGVRVKDKTPGESLDQYLQIKDWLNGIGIKLKNVKPPASQVVGRKTLSPPLRVYTVEHLQEIKEKLKKNPDWLEKDKGDYSGWFLYGQKAYFDVKEKGENWYFSFSPHLEVGASGRRLGKIDVHPYPSDMYIEQIVPFSQVKSFIDGKLNDVFQRFKKMKPEQVASGAEGVGHVGYLRPERYVTKETRKYFNVLDKVMEQTFGILPAFGGVPSSFNIPKLSVIIKSKNVVYAPQYSKFDQFHEFVGYPICRIEAKEGGWLFSTFAEYGLFNSNANLGGLLRWGKQIKSYPGVLQMNKKFVPYEEVEQFVKTVLLKRMQKISQSLKSDYKRQLLSSGLFKSID